MDRSKDNISLVALGRHGGWSSVGGWGELGGYELDAVGFRLGVCRVQDSFRHPSGAPSLSLLTIHVLVV
jgi:hypothetical protein